MPTPMKFSKRIKIGLVLFGVALGLVLGEISLEVLQRAPRGTQFEKLSDLKRALVDESSVAQQDDVQASERVTMKHIVNPHPNDRIIYDLRPGLSGQFAGAPISINSCGMRGPEVEIEKPSGTYRIALLGDSFAFGWGVKEEESFAYLIEKYLNKISQGQPKFEVLNFGVPGYSTFQEVESFKTKALDFKPDAVIVFFVENDFEFPFWVRDISNPGGLVSGFKIAELARRAIDPKIDQQATVLKGYDPNKALAELAKLSRQNNFKIWLAINPRNDWKTFYRKLWIMRKAPEIKFMDLWPGYISTVRLHGYTESDLNLPKDLHPSALRHSIYAALMATYFFPEIQGLN